MLTKVFCRVDDFCKQFEPKLNQYLIEHCGRKRIRKQSLSISEVATIVILFHAKGYRCLKHFYMNHVCKYWHKHFHGLVSYNRFVELMPQALMVLSAFLQTRYGKVSGISYIDSTGIAVCEKSRALRHKVFKDEAGWGKSSTHWYYGFKLHLIINDTGELLAVKCTSGNTDDRAVLEDMCCHLFGKLFGDKGYISKAKAQLLKEKYDVDLITTRRKNMKPQNLPAFDKVLLRGRAIIETVNDQLKNISQIEHTRHRSKFNFMVNLLAGLVAYTFQKKKPSLNIQHTGLVELVA
ncbi:IS982 family transposase [Endozoicomonas sp. Mp262]|uniref:IS982 family transposase n=1 Tax=Endozoicomonas sp. Mp262 TaxID=2919499 RepID=UPI0021DB54CE